MTARVIDGKARAERLTADVRSRVAQRTDAGKAAPGLAVVLVGENSASQVYVRNKRKTTDAVGMNSFAHDLPATTTEDRASGARRHAEPRPGRERDPGPAAAAETHRRCGGHRAHRPAEGRRRLSSVQHRPPRAETPAVASVHAVWLHDPAEGDRRRARRQARGRHRAIEHRRPADGAGAPDGALHGHDLPLANARPAGTRPSGRHRRRSRGQGELRPGRLGEARRDRHRRRHQPQRRRQALRRRRLRRGEGARVVDHAGAGRRRAR